MRSNRSCFVNNSCWIAEFRFLKSWLSANGNRGLICQNVYLFKAQIVLGNAKQRGADRNCSLSYFAFLVKLQLLKVRLWRKKHLLSLYSFGYWTPVVHFKPSDPTADAPNQRENSINGFLISKEAAWVKACVQYMLTFILTNGCPHMETVSVVIGLHDHLWLAAVGQFLNSCPVREVITGYNRSGKSRLSYRGIKSWTWTLASSPAAELRKP